MNRRARLSQWLAARRKTELAAASLAAVSSRVDDSPGWRGLTVYPHERDAADIQELYTDSLAAWRKNPLAKRIVDIQIDYILGDGIQVSSPFPPLNDFITAFWHHPRNHLDTRLPAMVAELARAGDLFPLLFRNPADGMSFLRFVTKDQIQQIVTAPNDWETEVSYVQATGAGETRVWRGPAHPAAGRAEAVMLHFAVNRPIGALLGEGDLTTMLPWLLRYSRMLEDRVRLHWALRTFLWFVTVPPNKVAEKQAQYRHPPEPGSIVVKEAAEEWETKTPLLHAADARHDLTAVRRIIDAGAGIPPHWRGEPENATLATAEAMQAPAERHLKQRQRELVYFIQELLLTAYRRQPNYAPLPTMNMQELFAVVLPDITRTDNLELAQATQAMAGALATLVETDFSGKPAVAETMLRHILTVLGQPPSAGQMAELLAGSSRDSSSAASGG